MPLVSPRLWLRRAVFWAGAVAVSLAAIAFAALADAAADLFARMAGGSPWLVLMVAPLGLVVSVIMTRRLFPGAQGSGIPQVIAAIHLSDPAVIVRVLSPRIAAGKVMLTLLGLLSGASIGREGPTVQVGATIMHAMGRLLRLPRPDLERALVLAGGAAGVSAAFNTPLAGIVFAIEELSHSFEVRASGTVLTAVIISGVCTLALVGNYTYFGSTAASVDLGSGWLAVVALRRRRRAAGRPVQHAADRGGVGVAGPRRRVACGAPHHLRSPVRLGGRAAGLGVRGCAPTAPAIGRPAAWCRVRRPAVVVLRGQARRHRRPRI